MFGLVTNIGFLTTKGSLVRDILYPKEIKFQFYADGMKFVAIMAFTAIIGFFCTVPFMVLRNHTSFWNLVDRSLDLITITVPPALPAAMSCGVMFAINRLKKEKIFCIAPTRINLAGRVTTFTFDKTGTLTEDGLSVQGFRSTNRTENETNFTEFSKSPAVFAPEGVWWNDSNAAELICSNPVLFVEAMASCTAITYVEGLLVGDPLDVKMFEATGWIMDEPHTKAGEKSADPGILIA